MYQSTLAYATSSRLHSPCRSLATTPPLIVSSTNSTVNESVSTPGSGRKSRHGNSADGLRFCSYFGTRQMSLPLTSRANITGTLSFIMTKENIGLSWP